MANIFKKKLYKLLEQDSRLWDEEKEELNEMLLNDLIDKMDEKLIKLLLSNKEVKAKFFIKIKDAFVFKGNDLKFFIDENKIDNSYTQYQIKIGLSAGNKLLIDKDEVVLDWPFKDCILEGGMTKEDEERSEIFFNEVLAADEIDRLKDPKVLVNWERNTIAGKEEVKGLKRDAEGIIQENLIVKGNNLLALHSLIEQFSGEVKLIYIDPPYNRDADTFYNDNFKHSTWLTFMQNRLMVAKDLLKEDGAIFVQIDSREQAYLKVLMDQVFGRENFLSTISIKSKAEGGVGKEEFLLDVTEYVLCYSKNPDTEFNVPKEEMEFNPKEEQNYKHILEFIDYGKYVKTISSGKVGDIKIFHHKKYKIITLRKKDRKIEKYVEYFKKIFRTTNPQGGLMKKVIPQLPTAKDKLISIEYTPSKGKRKGQVVRSYFLNKDLLAWLFDTAKIEGKKIIKFTKKTNFWAENMHQGIAKEGDVTLLSGKKPERLLQQILDIGSEKGDIVLDYHLGSGTTCAVAHKMGRRYIGIEQLDYGKNDSVIRLKNVIKGDQSGISKAVKWKKGGQFVYFELGKWNEEAKEKIMKTKSLHALEELFDELYEKYFLNYNVEVKEFKERIIKEEGFKNLSLDRQKAIFCKMLDLNQMYVNFSERKDKRFNLSKEDISLSEEFYNFKK